MRWGLSIPAGILLMLAAIGAWVGSDSGGWLEFEPAENLLRLFLGALMGGMALWGSKAAVRRWTELAAWLFAGWGALGLVYPWHLGIHAEMAENLLYLGLSILCWSLGRRRGGHNPDNLGQAAIAEPVGQPAVIHAPGELPEEAVGGRVEADVTVTDEMLLQAAGETANWLTYYHDYSGRSYVPDTQINPQNVRRLVPRWIFQSGVPGAFETTPLVVDGIMYITTPMGPQVFALNAATGEAIWHYQNPVPEEAQVLWPVNRGVALGGDRLYFCTLDARLCALDSRTGRLLWAVQVGNPVIGESLTQAPLYYKGRVIVGLSGSEYNAKGRMHCFDAETGRLRWVFQTVANFGWGTGDPRLYGGACPWMTGVIDPETETLFFGTGNPSPDFYGEVRPGPNAYSSAIVALDLNTGRLRWYYQITPHDLWDYDAAAPILLYTAAIGGRPVKVVGHAGKNGYYYVLDRATGKLLVRSEEFVPHRNFLTPPTPEGVEICPGIFGGSEWVPAPLHPDYGLVYISASNSCSLIRGNPDPYVPGELYWGSAYAQLIGEATGSLTAMDASTGKIRWQYQSRLPMIGGAVATSTRRAGGGLVFTGEQDGYFSAFHAETGERLWRFQCGTGLHAPPISFRAGGRQLIAVAVGNSPAGYLKGLGVQELDTVRVAGGRPGDTVIAFGLPDEKGG